MTRVMLVLFHQHGGVYCVQPCFPQHLHESSEQSVLLMICPQHPLPSGFTLIFQTAGAKGLFLKGSESCPICP